MKRGKEPQRPCPKPLVSSSHVLQPNVDAVVVQIRFDLGDGILAEMEDRRLMDFATQKIFPFLHASSDYNVAMTTLEEIKVAIEKLSPSQRAELEAYLQQADDAWDRQIAADAQTGKLNRLIAQVDANIDAGNLREFP